MICPNRAKLCSTLPRSGSVARPSGDRIAAYNRRRNGHCGCRAILRPRPWAHATQVARRSQTSHIAAGNFTTPAPTRMGATCAPGHLTRYCTRSMVNARFGYRSPFALLDAFARMTVHPPRPTPRLGNSPSTFNRFRASRAAGAPRPSAAVLCEPPRERPKDDVGRPVRQPHVCLPEQACRGDRDLRVQRSHPQATTLVSGLLPACLAVLSKCSGWVQCAGSSRREIAGET